MPTGQVLDFVAFKERLERSHTRAVARSESAVYRVQVAASGAATKGDFAGARLAALEALSDLQQPPDVAQVRMLPTNPYSLHWSSILIRVPSQVRKLQESHVLYSSTLQSATLPGQSGLNLTSLPL